MGTSSAIPANLQRYADEALEIDDRLTAAAGPLGEALDRFRSGDPEFMGPVPALDRTLVALAGRAGDHDQWVGAVGAAFEAAGGGGAGTTAVSVDHAALAPLVAFNLAQLMSPEERERFEAGAALAEELIAAMEAGDENVAVKLIEWIGGDDDSARFARALQQMHDNLGDEHFQAGLLDRLGPEQLLRLESLLDDNDAYSHLARESLSTASRAHLVAPDFEEEVVRGASLAALQRFTSDPQRAPMSDVFLVATGKKILAEDVGWEHKIHSRWYAFGANPQAFDVVKDHVDQILQNIAATSPMASAAILADHDAARNLLKIGNIEPDAEGVPTLIRAGTELSVRRQDADAADAALVGLARALADPAAINSVLSVLGGIPPKVDVDTEDRIVPPAVAAALADAYQHNVAAFGEAARVRSSSPDTLYKDDVRNVLIAILEHEDTHQQVETATQVLVAKILHDGTNFAHPDRPHSLDIAATHAGEVSGVFADAYAQALFDAAERADKRAEVVASLLGGGVGFAAKFVPGGTLASAGSGLVAGEISRIISDELAGRAAGEARDVVDQRADSARAAVKQTALEAYYDSAVAALRPGSGASRAAQADAEAFVQAVEEFDASLPSGHILEPDDGSGRPRDLVDIRGFDLDDAAEAAVVVNREVLVNGSSEHHVVAGSLDGILDDIEIAVLSQTDGG